MYLLQIFKLNAKFFCILPVFPCLHLDPFCTPLPGYLPGSTTFFFFFFFNWTYVLHLGCPISSCLYFPLPPLYWLSFGCSWISMLPTTQEAVCSEIINIAEKSVHYCSAISQPLDSRHKVTSNDHKPSLIISQQPQAQQQGASPDRSQTPRDM